MVDELGAANLVHEFNRFLCGGHNAGMNEAAAQEINRALRITSRWRGG